MFCAEEGEHEGGCDSLFADSNRDKTLVSRVLRYENFIRHYAAQSTAGYRLLPPSVMAPADLRTQILITRMLRRTIAVRSMPTKIMRPLSLRVSPTNFWTPEFVVFLRSRFSTRAARSRARLIRLNLSV